MRTPPPAVNFAIAGSGAYLPSRVVSAEELGSLANVPGGCLAAKYGIRQRHYAGPEETSSRMAAAAAQEALDEAGWAPGQFDVLIAACGVMEQPIPTTAVLVQRELGLGHSGIPAFDVNATCLSFLLAFDRVLAGFALGEWRRALVVSADIASAALDYSDPEASVLFGDGAVAFALEADGPHRRLANAFATFGEAADACRLEAGGTRLRPHGDIDTFLAASRFAMDGSAVFRATSRRFPAFLDSFLAKAGVGLAEIDCIIPHQASAAALEHLRRAFPGGGTRMVDVYADTGNIIAASLPYALHTARARGWTQPGTLGLLIGSGAGISLGGAIVRW